MKMCSVVVQSLTCSDNVSIDFIRCDRKEQRTVPLVTGEPNTLSRFYQLSPRFDEFFIAQLLILRLTKIPASVS